MVLSGYGATVKKSGTSTAFTGEATTNTSGNIWQITDDAKEVFDRDVVPDYYDNAVPIVVGDIASIDYLYGIVTFTGAKTGPITVDGSYMPMAAVACAKDVNLNRTSTVLDDTCLGNAGYHTKLAGIHDASVTLGRWDDLTFTFTALIAARVPIVIEIAPDTNKSYRGWFLAESSDQNLDLNALIEESISFQLDGDDTTGKTFSRSDA